MFSRSNPRRRLPGICLHAPSGRVYVRLSGRVIYLGSKDDPKVQENYDREIQSWLALGRRRAVATAPQVECEGDKYTIDHLIVDYLDSIQRRGRYTKNGVETSEMASIRAALRSLSEVCGSMHADQLGKKVVRRFEEHLIENGSLSRCGERNVLSRPGVNRKVRHVKRMILWGHDEELIPDAVAGAIKLLRPLRRGETKLREPKRRESVSDEDVQKTLEHLAPEIGTMVRIQRRTGMRPGEVCLMRWCDIDKTPIVASGITCWTYRPSAFKTEHWGKEVSYPLDPICIKLLEPFSAVPAGAFLFSPRIAAVGRRIRLRRNRKSIVQPSQRSRDERASMSPRRKYSERYDAKSYALAIRRACARAGVEVWTPHQLRHARITEIAHDPRLGAMAASIVANHSSLSATERYIHHDRQLAYEAAVSPSAFDRDT